MGTIKKMKDSTTRYVVVPSFTMLAVIRPNEYKTIDGSEPIDRPDALVNIGTVFKRPDIYKTAQAHSDHEAHVKKAFPKNVSSESIKFCDHDKVLELFKEIEVFDHKTNVVSLNVAKAIRK